MKVKTETIVRTICLFLTLANLILAHFGKEKLPITNEDVYQLVSLIAAIVVSMWTWWKNNSFTQNAIKADEYLAKLRSGEDGVK